MRAALPRRRREDEEESVFVSMTDMTISFLFILMILLAFFASRFSDEEMVPLSKFQEAQELIAQLQDTVELLSGRAEITPEALEAIRTQLNDASDLAATLNETVAVLSARAEISPEELANLRNALQDAQGELEDVAAQLNRENERLQREKASLEEQLEVARARLARLEQEFTSEETSLRAALATIERLNEMISQMQEELEKLRPLEEEVVELRKKIQELEEQLEEMQRPDPLEQYLRQVAESRRIALQDLRDAIRQEFPDLQVVISSEADALRFQGEGLFASGSRTLTVEKRRIVERIAELLDDLLPCYSLGPRSAYDRSCNPGFAVIEAVQIEGHTDDQGTDTYNMQLSSGRAVSTYAAMSRHVPELLEHFNLDGEPVLSIAGYGEARPIASNETAEGRATNRRIDLRFIMFSPSQTEEIQIIRRRLLSTRPEEE